MPNLMRPTLHDPSPVPPAALLDRLEDRRLFAVGLAATPPTTPTPHESVVAVSTETVSPSASMVLPGPTTRLLSESSQSPLATDADDALAMAALTADWGRALGGHHGPAFDGFGHPGWTGPRIVLNDYGLADLPTGPGDAAAAAANATPVTLTVTPAATAQTAVPTAGESVVPVRTVQEAPASKAVVAVRSDEAAARAAVDAVQPVAGVAADGVLAVGTPAARPTVVSFFPAQTADAVAAAMPAGSGLARLLDFRENVAAGTTFRVALPEAVRSRPGTTELDAGEDVAGVVVVAEPRPEQAALLPTGAEAAATRPMWQKVAVSTAAAVLVSANWVVRRRNRKIAMAVRRG